MEGQKFSSEKPTPELLEPDFILDMSKVLRIGKEKYSVGNWKNPPLNSKTYFGAAMRHLLAAMNGQVFDPEDGATHLSKVAINCMFADWHWKRENFWDSIRIAEQVRNYDLDDGHANKILARQEEKGK